MTPFLGFGVLQLATCLKPVEMLQKAQHNGNFTYYIL